MYAIAGKIATSIASIIITDILMEKYDVRSKIKDRYTQACTGITRLAAKVRVSQGEDESATSGEEAQAPSYLKWRQRLNISEARLQYRLARRAQFKADWRLERAVNHARYCNTVVREYRANYIKTVPFSAWAGDE